jgi:3-hydroxymyristoyl/3-hydroxydecanoyl-(acyl carrier protein) dehydratase
MLQENAHIKQYIPQREPMMMVDELIKHGDGETVSAFKILADNVLVDGSHFSEAGLLENMAQTAALGKGYEFVEKNEQPPIGFIGAVKNFEIIELPVVGSYLQTHLKLKHEVLNASIVDVEVICEDKTVARCELKIFINPEID